MQHDKTSTGFEFPKKTRRFLKMTTEFIENLFYKQVKNLTMKTMDTFDMQHSDAWL